jgi:type I restriction enzyme, S subunit
VTEISTRWSLRRLRDVAGLRVSNVDKHEKDGEVPVRLCNYVDVYKNERITDRIMFMRATATPEEAERFRLRRGDVLITKDSETWTDIGVPALVEYEAPDLISGYHLALLRPRSGQVTGGFLLRALQSPDVAHQLHVAATGVTRYGLSHNAIKSLVLPVPPLGDQISIVRFLDHADRRVRRAIHAKRELIMLLNEQKQAMVHHAVTRGLDPNALLKPSGVNWLGDVPEDWQVRKLGSLFRVQGSGTTPPHDTDYGGTVPWVMTGELNDGEIAVTRRTVTEAALESLSALRRFPRGSLVVAMYGATIGKTGVLGMEAATNQACCVLADPFENVNVRYVQLCVQLARSDLKQRAYGGGQPNINAEVVRSLRVPVPSRDEQDEIIRKIGAQTAAISASLDAAQGEVELLREYRARLVADVVTGQLDVRAAAAALPDETDELERVDELDFEEADDPDMEVLDVADA